MRWTIRGIPDETADAVREVAYETGCSLGEVVTLCVHHGLAEARRQLEAEDAKHVQIETSPEHTVIRIREAIANFMAGQSGR